jgi:hypothetical protein
MPSLKASISEYKDRHKGEEAWLFAKGLGLDYYDFDTAGSLRATINNACHVVPDPTYCFSWHTEETYKPCCTFFTNEGVEFTSDFREVDIPNGVFFKRHSSVELAVSSLIYMGVVKLHVIGVNPNHCYSKHFPMKEEYIKKMLKFDRSPRSFYNDMVVRGKTLKNSLALLDRYGVEVVLQELDQPEQTFLSFMESIYESLSETDRKKYVRWNKKASKAFS